MTGKVYTRLKPHYLALYTLQIASDYAVRADDRAAADVNAGALGLSI